MAVAPTTAPAGPRPTGITRARTLWRLFRNEQTDPEPFYRYLAVETVDALEARHGSLVGARILDLGSGPGWYADELRRRGATVAAIERDPDEIGEGATGLAIGDAAALPFPDGSADGILCSNMLEHAPDTRGVIDEIARVLRPGGWCYLSWTNWYSPWGGHDMTPYQFLGPELGPKLYEKRHGPPRKNRYGEGLFAVHVGPTLDLVRSDPRLVVDDVEPRYWPWAKAVASVPGVREVVMWNCVIHMRRPDAVAADERGDGTFEDTWDDVADVEGWMTLDQARRLWDAAREVPAGGRIVEIGSYQGRSATVLARAAEKDVEVVAIDPHAGNDRGPRQWEGTAEEGQSDNDRFWANLRRNGVADVVRHVRKFSDAAHGDVDDPIDLLYVDGAHKFDPARADIRDWGARVRPGGVLLVHDSFSSVGVTLALVAERFTSGEWRYEGRSQSMTQYRRVPVRGRERLANLWRQVVELPWFARNLVVKLAIVGRQQWIARLLGHREGPWPF